MDAASEDLKIWSVEEADAALPRVRAILPRLRAGVEEQRFGLEQASDLARETKDAVRVETHPLHDEYRSFLDRARHGREVADAAVAEIASLGIEVKDPTLGLLDFPTIRGHELVYLCWRDGEPSVAHWHPVAGGFAGRKPLDALVRAGGR